MIRALQCAVLIGGGVAETAASAAVFHDDPALQPGDEGYYGPEFETDFLTGQPTASVEITPRPAPVDYWVEVEVQGLGIDLGWSMGPYSDEQSPFAVDVDLPAEANAPGLVEVIVLVTLTDPETGDTLGHVRARPVYVANAGRQGESWYDEAYAAAHVVRPAGVSQGENEVFDELVGLEVSP